MATPKDTGVISHDCARRSAASLPSACREGGVEPDNVARPSFERLHLCEATAVAAVSSDFDDVRSRVVMGTDRLECVQDFVATNGLSGARREHKVALSTPCRGRNLRTPGPAAVSPGAPSSWPARLVHRRRAHTSIPGYSPRRSTAQVLGERVTGGQSNAHVAIRHDTHQPSVLHNRQDAAVAVQHQRGGGREV